MDRGMRYGHMTLLILAGPGAWMLYLALSFSRSRARFMVLSHGT